MKLRLMILAAMMMCFAASQVSANVPPPTCSPVTCPDAL